MNYRLIYPKDLLKKYVRFFWILEDDDLTEKKFITIPDGTPGLIFQEDPTVFDRYGQTLPQLFLFGQATSHAELSLRGSFRSVGVSFQPSGLRSVFGMDANELTDQHIDLDHLTNTSITDEVLDKRSIEKKVDVLEAFLSRQAARREKENEKVEWASSQLRDGRQLKQVQTDLQISERSLERLFKQHIGISPILYARICRFQTALQIMRRANFSSLTEIAFECNYFDQSHFIREFKIFAGATPKHFLQKAKEKMPNFPEWEL
ncbi:MAG: AraC family transcriptional regulator [Chitinophagaceae bacterium]|nr:AraC family transcriptional regulator [Chitinophagaceae bacterium]